MPASPLLVRRNPGLEPHLFYFERRPTEWTGNLLLNRLLEAHMHFLPLGAGGPEDDRCTNRLVHLLAWLRLGRHSFIPVGGYSWRGKAGHVPSRSRSAGVAAGHRERAPGAGADRGTWRACSPG
jgi:hypothetical protein